MLIVTVWNEYGVAGSLYNSFSSHNTDNTTHYQYYEKL